MPDFFRRFPCVKACFQTCHDRSIKANTVLIQLGLQRCTYSVGRLLSCWCANVQVGMRYFHKNKNQFHCPIINLDKIWSLMGEEVRSCDLLYSLFFSIRVVQ